MPHSLFLFSARLFLTCIKAVRLACHLPQDHTSSFLDPPDDKAATEFLKKQVSEASDIKMRPGSRAVANDKGSTSVDTLTRLNQLEEAVAALQKEIEDFRPLMLKIRASELECQSETFDHKARSERNHIVHGGLVKLDLKSLNSLTNQTRLDNAVRGFQVLYGQDASDLGPKLKIAPKEVIDTLNRRGDLVGVDTWKSSPRSKPLIEKCDEIIMTWLNTFRAGSSSNAESEIKKKYDELKKDMDI